MVQKKKKKKLLGHHISAKEIQVERAKIEVIEKLPPPTSVKAIKSFLGHAGFYQRFIKRFFKDNETFMQAFTQRCAF